MAIVAWEEHSGRALAHHEFASGHGAVNAAGVRLHSPGSRVKGLRRCRWDGDRLPRVHREARRTRGSGVEPLRRTEPCGEAVWPYVGLIAFARYCLRGLIAGTPQAFDSTARGRRAARCTPGHDRRHAWIPRRGFTNRRCDEESSRFPPAFDHPSHPEPRNGATKWPRKPDAPLSAQAVPRGAPSLASAQYVRSSRLRYSMNRRSRIARSTLWFSPGSNATGILRSMR